MFDKDMLDQLKNVFEKLENKIVINFSGLTIPGIPVRTHTVQNSLQLCFAHIFKIREFINQPGSSVKNLMESIALKIPNF